MPDEFKIKITADATSALQGAQQTAAELGKVGDVGKEAMREVGKETEKTTWKKGELKKALEAVGREFPILGAAARLAFNPLALAAAAVTMLFQKLRQDIASLDQSLTSSTWDSYGGAVAAQRKTLQEAAQDVASLARELARVGTEAGTATAASERMMTVFKAQQSAADRLDEARRGLEVARVKAGGADPLRQAQAVAEIEERYAARKRARDNYAANVELAEQRRKMDAEGQAVLALGKQLEGARNRQAGLESEAAITEKIRVERSRLAAIDEEIAKKGDRLEELGRNAILTYPQQVEMSSLYGQMDSLQSQRRAQARLAGKVEAAAPGQISAWRAAGEEIGWLERMQKGAAERGIGIATMLPTQERVAGIEAQTRGAVGGMQSETRLTDVYSQANAESKRIMDAIVQAVRDGAKVTAEQLQELRNAQEVANQQIRSLQNTRKHNPPST